MGRAGRPWSHTRLARLGAVGRVLVLVVVSAAAVYGFARLRNVYRLYGAEAALQELTRVERYRVLTAEAVREAVPKWAEGLGLRADPAAIGVRIVGHRTQATPESTRRSRDEAAAAREVVAVVPEAAELFANLGVGRAKGHPVELTIRLAVQAETFGIVARRELEVGAVFSSVDKAYVATPPGLDWETRRSEAAAGGLAPLPGRVTDTLAALRAQRRAEAALAGALGQRTLAPVTSARGRLRGSGARIEGADAAARTLRGWLSTDLEGVEGWLGAAGATRLSAYAALLEELQGLLEMARADLGQVPGPLAAYLARRAEVMPALRDALARAGVYTPD